MLPPDSAAHYQENVAGFDLHSGPEWLPLDPVAGPPDEDNENCDQPNADRHPVLAFEPQKSKMLSENLHAPAPIPLWQDKEFICAG
jgi:hypothetical protein